jgi:hypothetical protein
MPPRPELLLAYSPSVNFKSPSVKLDGSGVIELRGEVEKLYKCHGLTLRPAHLQIQYVLVLLHFLSCDSVGLVS